jgi:hypothetical protein
MIEWSKHLKHEDPHFSPTFQRCTMTPCFPLAIMTSRVKGLGFRVKGLGIKV